MPISSSKLWIVFPIFPVSWAKNLFLFLPFHFSLISHVFHFHSLGASKPHIISYGSRPTASSRASAWRTWVPKNITQEFLVCAVAVEHGRTWEEELRLFLWSTVVFLTFHVILIFPHFSSPLVLSTSLPLGTPSPTIIQPLRTSNSLTFSPSFQLPCLSLHLPLYRFHGL